MTRTEWQLYTLGEDAWEAMLRGINEARHTIDIEQYIFSSDETGDEFSKALIAATKRGVKIRVLCDGVGSNSGTVGDLNEQELIKHGIEVVFFNEQRYWKLLWRVFWFWSTILRDHSKIMIVDSKIGYTGGIGIRADMRTWRDTHMRITGPVVASMKEAFDEMWKGAKAKKQFMGFWPKVIPDSEFQFLMNFPKPRQRFIYYELLAAIRRAKSYVYLTTPYFVPTRRFSHALKKAVARGVDVRLLVPEKTDHRIVDAAGQSYFWVALKAGIGVYRYQPGMLHSKTAIVDDAWATVGSANLDNLSLLLNYEGNIFSTNKEFVSQLRDNFFEDISKSKQLNHKEWKQRPLIRKVFELVTWPFHRLL